MANVPGPFIPQSRPCPKRAWLCVLLLALAPRLAPAACPAGPADPPLSLPAELERLAALATRCADDPSFLAWYGALLLEAGRAQTAAELLERALLLDPAHQGARLDYARALRALGETAAARALLAQVGARPDLPPAAARVLHDLLAMPEAAAWRTRTQFTLRSGYDDNLNRATEARSLVLTLPGGWLDLPLAADSRARAGSFAAAELDHTAEAPLGHASELRLYGRLSARYARDRNDDTAADLLVYLGRRQPARTHHFGLGGGLQQWQGRPLQRSLRLSWRAQPNDSPCGLTPGTDLEARHHPTRAALDYTLLMASAAWACAGDRPWTLQWSVGRELAGDERPGGGAWRATVRGELRLPLAGGRRVALAVQLAHRRDDASYSPWLEGGARLRLSAFNLRLDAAQPLAAGWQVVFTLEYDRQAANLALFDHHRRAISIGLVRLW